MCVCVSMCVKMQEFRSGAQRQAVEIEHVNNSNKRLRAQLSDCRDKLAQLDSKVLITE